jgi:hypothetical protein
MKKFLAITGVLIGTVAFAGGTDEPKAGSGVAVIKNGETSYRLIYKGDKESDVNVTIYDASNKLVFSDKVKHTDGFTRPYNFSNLKEGDYTIAVEDGSGTKVEKINHRSLKQSKAFHVVKLSSQAGKFLVTASGKGKEDITINIFDGSKLVHSEKKSINGDFAQLYNLSKAKGSLTFEIAGENGEVKRMAY